MARGYYIITAQNRFAYGLAMLWVLFAFILVFTILFVKFGGFWVYTEAEDRR
jgi:ABC-type sugar transport system permease subunit